MKLLIISIQFHKSSLQNGRRRSQTCRPPSFFKSPEVAPNTLLFSDYDRFDQFARETTSLFAAAPPASAQKTALLKWPPVPNSGETLRSSPPFASGGERAGGDVLGAFGCRQRREAPRTIN
ncbi:hypothetical protein L596_008679 [Steinernema carpocapsae]|uniref:Uncharacterized protein n=1 Tax=Steinernema carpocapsae TaxID=34508 RepID=A0A4U5PDG6_STECR|nr:hypothetical protein L596_008679 [Steinernema carpocapsae]